MGWGQEKKLLYSYHTKDGLKKISEILKLPEYEAINTSVQALIAKQITKEERFKADAEELNLNRDQVDLPQQLLEIVAEAPFGIKDEDLEVAKPAVMLAQVLYLDDSNLAYRAYKTLNRSLNKTFEKIKRALFPTSSKSSGTRKKSDSKKEKQSDSLLKPGLGDKSNNELFDRNGEESECLDSKKDVESVKSYIETEEEDIEGKVLDFDFYSEAEAEAESDAEHIDDDNLSYDGHDSFGSLLNKEFQDARNSSKGNRFRYPTSFLLLLALAEFKSDEIMRSSEYVFPDIETGHVELHMTSQSFCSLLVNRPKNFSPEILSCIIGLPDPLQYIELALLLKADLVRNLQAMVLLIPSKEKPNTFVERLIIYFKWVSF